jgi:nucleotide-binding universal stress UspA family protein
VESLAALGPDDVDMLVCGSRGGPIRRVLLGGVSSRLIRRARLSVAAYHGQLPRPRSS